MSGSRATSDGTGEHSWDSDYVDSHRNKRLKLSGSRQLESDSQASGFYGHEASNNGASQLAPAKQPTRIKLSFKLGASKRQQQEQQQERLEQVQSSSASPAIASRGYAHRHNKRLFSDDDNGDSYYSGHSDDEPVDIDDDSADIDKGDDARLPEDRDRQMSNSGRVLGSEPAAGHDVSGNHTPRIKLRFSLKQNLQLQPQQQAKDEDKDRDSRAGVVQPPTIASTPLQADTTAASSSYTGWGSDYGSVAPGSPSGSVASNASLSTYRRRISGAGSVSRGAHSGMYSPSLASEAESEDSEAEARHHHTFEHMPSTPVSASVSASASATPAPPGTVKRRGRPPLRGRRSSSISSWHARGGQAVATRKPSGASQGVSTTVSLKSSLARLIKRIRKRDSYGFFLEPVDTKVITDYLTIIKHPMDLGTIQAKVEANSYTSIGDFRRDILLVCENARKYNGDGSIYARSADRVKEYATVAIDRETTKLERVGMASISSHAGGNNDYGFAYRSRSRSNSRSRSRSRSATPSQYNSAAEDQSDSLVGRDHRRSTRLRWRGAGSGAVSDAPGAAANNVNTTPAAIVDVFKWSGGAKKKAKRGSNVPKRVTESQTKVHILADGSIDPAGFEEEVALIPYESNHTALPLLAGTTSSLGSSLPGGAGMARPHQHGQVNAYGQLFTPMSFADIGPYSKVRGQSLASVSAGLSTLGIDLQPIHGDSLGMAYWASISDFIGDAGDDVAEYATTVMDHLTNGSHRVARDTLHAITAEHGCASERPANGASAKSEYSSDVDILRLVRWLDKRGARDLLFAERVDALTRKIVLSELLVGDDVSTNEADSTKHPDYITDARRNELFDDTAKWLKSLYELEKDASVSAERPSRDSICKQIKANIAMLSQQMCMSLAGSHLPSTPVPGLSLPPPRPAVASAGNALPKYPFTATASTAMFPLSGKSDDVAAKSDIAPRPNRAVSSPSLPSLHSSLPLRQTSKPL